MDSFIPRGGLYTPSETSRLNSSRDRGSPAHGWKNDRQALRRGNGVTQQASQIRRELDRTAYQQRKTTSGLYPFKVYQYPDELRMFHNADDWRRVRVRGPGGILPDLAITASGTDHCVDPYSDNYLSGESPPIDSSTFVLGANWHEVIVPIQVSTEAYEILYSLVIPVGGQGVAGVTVNDSSGGFCFGKIGENPQTVTIIETGETYSDSTNLIQDYNSYRKRIATVNANPGINPVYVQNDPWIQSSITSGTLIVQQAADLTGMAPAIVTGLSASGTNFRGAYDAAARYYAGDVVYDDRSESPDWGGGGTVTMRYLSWYAPQAGVSIYCPTTLFGPMVNISPSGHSPDPWVILSRSKMP